MYLRHSLSSANLPQKMTPERLTELTNKLMQRTLTSEEESEIVDGHLRLLLSYAQKWSIRSPHLSDLFVADGLYAMLKAIRKAPDKLNPERTLTQYISIHIITEFKKTVANQQVIKSTLCTHTRDTTHIKNGKVYVTKKRPRLKRHALPRERTGGGGIEIEETVSRELVPIAQGMLTERLDHHDLRELFELAPSNVFEKAVLELKKHGYNNTEIAAQLKVRRGEISEAMFNIEKKLRKLLAA